MNTRRILCVHRGPELEDLRGRLEQDGCEVLPATNAQNALDVLASDIEVDGVVLDFSLQTPDGVALRNEIHQQRPDMPMLLVEGAGDIRKMPLDVFRAYLQDPRSPESIFAVIQN